MSAEVARRYAQEEAPVVYRPDDPTGGRLVAWAAGLQAAGQLGAALCQTSFVPAHFRGKAEETSAAILCGDELGLSPTQSLRSIYVVSGTPALYARAMVALVLSHGHEVWTEEDTPSKVTVSGRRRGSSHVETVTWTQDRARKAGYTNNRKYASEPQAMLYARASGDVARRVAPDVLAGVAYNVEELELAEAGTLTVRREPVAEVQTRIAQRAALPPRTEPEAPDLDERGTETDAGSDAPEETSGVEGGAGSTPADTSDPVSIPGQEELPQPEEDPEPIRPGQLRMLQASYRTAGIEDRTERLAHASGVIGRDVTSANDLTKEEASRVLDALTAGEEGDEPDG